MRGKLTNILIELKCLESREAGVLHPLPEIVRQDKVGERVEQRGQAGDGHRAQALQHCPLRLGQTLRVLLQAAAAGKFSSRMGIERKKDCNWLDDRRRFIDNWIGI